jgi:hypothetical protein
VDEHGYYTIQRVIVGLGMFWHEPALLIYAGFVFPFFHDGMYYETRRYLNSSIYRGGFFTDLPMGSSAIFSFGIITRVMFFVVGCSWAMIYVFSK